MPDPTATPPATTIRILDARGNHVTRIVKDQPVTVEVRSPATVDPASPPGRIEVSIAKEGGWFTDDLTIGWNGDHTGTGTTHVSAPLTIAGGGKGADAYTIEPLGLSWSKGDFAGLGTGDGQQVTVTGPDGSVGTVQVFTSGVTKAHADLADAANLRAGNARTAAAMLTDALAHLDRVATEPGVDAAKVADLRALIESRLSWAKRDLCVAERARAYLNNPELLTAQQNAAARYYLSGAAGADGSIDDSGIEQTLENAKDEMWDGAVLDSLTDLTKSAYQGLAKATGAAQVMTLFGTTEMGKPAKWHERATAALDLISMGMLMGANMKFQLDHAVRSSSPPRAWGPGNRPRYDGPEPKHAPSGHAVDPVDLGYSPDGVRAALNTARKHEVLIQSRPTVETAPQLKAEGAIPKSETWKAKTASPVDQLLGADPNAVHGRVSLFEPKADLFVSELRNAGVPESVIDRSIQAMRDAAAARHDIPVPPRPPDSAVPEGLWQKAAQRFGQRHEEWHGPTGQKMRAAAERGEIEIEPGGAVKEGGRYITGDYDLWDITDRHGVRVPKAKYDEIVAELQGNAFEAQHGAHTWWDPQRSAFPDGAKGDAQFQTARGIYEKIIADHAPGKEILISFGPEGPPVAVYAGQTPAPYLGAAPVRVGELAAGSRFVVPTELLWFAGNALVTQPIEYLDEVTSEVAGWLVEVNREAIPCESCVEGLIGATPTSRWKKPAIVGAAAAAVAVGLLFGALGGEDATEPERIAVGSDPVLVDDTEEDVEVFVPDATMVAFVGACAVTVHDPLIGFPDSPSHVLDTGIAVGVDGPLPEGVIIEATRAGADAPARAEVGERGVYILPFPVSSYDTYGILTLQVTAGDADLAVTSPMADVVVGPEEGTNGCTPAPDLDDTAIAALISDAGYDPGGGPGGPPAIEDDDPIPPPEDDLAIVREFLGRMDRAHQTADVGFLLDTLDPLTIGRYGRTQCEHYLTAVVGSITEIELLGGRRGPYDYPTDGLTVEPFEAWSVQIEATVQRADRAPFDLHLRQSGDGVTWFSDCGEPTG